MESLCYFCHKYHLNSIYMSKLNDLKAKHPEMVIDLIEIFAEHDPSKTNKYLEYMVKNCKEFVETELIKSIPQVFSDVFTAVEKFEKYIDSPAIENKDVNSYTLKELVEIVDQAENYKSNSFIKTNETIHLYRDENFNVIIPLSHASSMLYGSSTKWCTTQKSSSHFDTHIGKGVLIYVIVKKPNTPDKYKKIAWYVEGNKSSHTYGSGVSIWDSLDNQVKGFTETFELMNNLLDKPIRDKLLSVIATIENNGYNTVKNADKLKQFA